MKRDMNLARAILLAIEDPPYDHKRVELKLGNEVAEDVVSEHVRLLAEAGLIEAKISPRGCTYWRPVRLTSAGHDFLEAARDQSLWVKATTLMKDKVGGITFDALKAVLVKLATESMLRL